MNRPSVTINRIAAATGVVAAVAVAFIVQKILGLPDELQKRIAIIFGVAGLIGGPVTIALARRANLPFGVGVGSIAGGVGLLGWAADQDWLMLVGAVGIIIAFYVRRRQLRRWLSSRGQNRL